MLVLIERARRAPRSFFQAKMQLIINRNPAPRARPDPSASPSDSVPDSVPDSVTLASPHKPDTQGPAPLLLSLPAWGL
jgi:hypothetical protein